MKKISKELLTTIIAVGVAVVLVVAMFVPTIVSLTKNNKKMDNFDLQIEEFKTQIASLSTSDGITAADLEAALNKIVIPEAGLTEAQVKAIVEAALEGLDGLTEEEVGALITEALAGIDTGLAAEEIKALIESILMENGFIKPNPDDLTLAENIAIANDVTLAEDTTLSELTSLPATEHMVIDLNGKTLILDEYALIDVSGALSIKNGNIIVKSAAAFGLVVNEEGELMLRDVKITLTGTGATGVANYGDAKIIACEFEIDDTTAGFNCAIYNGGEMRIDNSSVKEVGTEAVVYVYGAPVYNSDTLIMDNVAVASSAFCTSSFGGTITVDSVSTFTLTGEKNLTPDGDYFAYNASNGYKPTSNDCYEFKYLGKAEANKANLDFKAVFANGGSITLTEDAVIGSAFTVADGKTVVIDLGGNTLTLNENAYFAIANGNATVKNGTVVAETCSDETRYCFTVSAASSLTFEGVTFNNESDSDGIYNAGTLVINDSALATAEGCGGVSGSLIYNCTGKSGVEATATITNSTIDITAAVEEKYYTVIPIINYGTMTLDETTVKSNTSCIYAGSPLAKTVIVDGAMTHGTGDKCAVVFAESASFLFGTEVDVIWTVDGVEVEVSVIYLTYNA